MDSDSEDTSNFILLPELKLITHWQQDRFRNHYKCKKESAFDVCPRCAVKSYSVHDRRWVNIKDYPMSDVGVSLKVLKLRFRCPQCKKVFTEPLNGVRKAFKTNERYRRRIEWAVQNYKDLRRAEGAFSSSTLFIYYDQSKL